MKLNLCDSSHNNIKYIIKILKSIKSKNNSINDIIEIEPDKKLQEKTFGENCGYNAYKYLTSCKSYNLIQSKNMNIPSVSFRIKISDLKIQDPDYHSSIIDEIIDKVSDLNKCIDIIILQGNKITNNNFECSINFEGFINLFKTNTIDLKGEKITLDNIDDLAQNIINNEGKPGAIFTSEVVGRKIKELLLKKHSSQNFTQDFKSNDVEYMPPNCEPIPIIIDNNLKSSDSGDQLIMIDNSTIKFKDTPPYIQPLDKVNLTTSMIIAKNIFIKCEDESKNGFINNINSNPNNGIKS